jgi:hypothetical protein
MRSFREHGGGVAHDTRDGLGQRDEQIRPSGHEDHGQTFPGFDVGGRILMHVGAFLLSPPVLLSRRAPSLD